jgi:hypothetical protein
VTIDRTFIGTCNLFADKAFFPRSRKPNCKASMLQALDHCSQKDNHFSGGFSINGLGCLDYSLHISEGRDDKTPPWQKHDPVGMPQCKGYPNGSGLTSLDTDKAVDAFCSNHAEGDGNLYLFPPDGSHKAYHADERYTMQFKFDTNQKKMDKDDCTYALKRSFSECVKPDKVTPAEFTYRGVLYKFFYVNTANDWWTCTQQGKKCGDNPTSEP